MGVLGWDKIHGCFFVFEVILAALEAIVKSPLNPCVPGLPFTLLLYIY